MMRTFGRVWGVRAVGLGIFVGVAAGVVLASSAAAEVKAEGGLREDSNRLPLYAARREGGTQLPYVAVRVGDERRYALSASGREQLALRPAQVAAGGRVFVFAKVPAELGDVAFPAEFLVWRGGRWERRQVLAKPTGNLGHVSATLIVDGVPAGPIPTAVFRRQAEGGKVQSIVTPLVTVPPRARLKFGYAFDEWDWSGLAPVDVSIVALVEVEKDEKLETKEVKVFDQRFDPQGQKPGWIDATADLAALADENARFVFRAQPVLEHERLAPHLVWSAPAIVAKEPERTMPSIVMVLVDGVRASSLGCCGATRPVSPFLDKIFSEQGVTFEHAVTQAVETIPAHMTLFTGVYPCVHQIFSARQTLARELQTFAQVMSTGGYATAAFTDAAGLAAELGFGRGYDVFRQDSSLEMWNADGTAADVFAHANEWIAKHADEPFLAVVHTRQAKPPYVPPAQYVGLFKEAAAAAPNGEGVGELLRYDREIRYLDDVLAQFVGKLDAASAPARTLLIVTSAHGEEFLEHGAREHGAHLYEETVHVPLLMRGAGVRAKRRHDGIVGLIDVAPTVLELAGFGVPPAMQGKSIAKELRKGQAPELPPRFSEAHALRRTLADSDDAGWKPPAFAISDASHKLVTYVVEERRVLEAYDLATDPGEKADVLQASPTAPPWVTTLRDALETYANQCRSLARQPSKTETLPVSTLFKLKAFGYL